jgi:hypothetical protein
MFYEAASGLDTVTAGRFRKHPAITRRLTFQPSTGSGILSIAKPMQLMHPKLEQSGQASHVVS